MKDNQDHSAGGTFFYDAKGIFVKHEAPSKPRVGEQVAPAPKAAAKSAPAKKPSTPSKPKAPAASAKPSPPEPAKATATAATNATV